MKKRLIILRNCIFFFSSMPILSSVDDYIYPYTETPTISNYGTIGLLQMPSARFHEEGTLAFSWSSNKPYQRGSILAYPFDWFEASYQYTDVNNALYSDNKLFSGNQTYKDKSFDAKFKLANESKYFPAIALGFRDLAGTGIFSSEYLALSKRFNNLDFTLGVSWGIMSAQGYSNPLVDYDIKFKTRTALQDTLGGEFSIDSYFSGPMGAFAGAEIVIPNMRGTRFLIEYDSIDYSQQGFNDVNDPFLIYLNRTQASKINFGFMYPVTENLHFKLGYTKGNTLNFSFSFKQSIGRKSSTVKKYEPLIKNYDPAVAKRVLAKDERLLYLAALRHLSENNLYLQNADISDDTFSLSYAQSKYHSGVKSLGRVATILDDLSPDKIKTFEVTYLNGALGLNKARIDRDSFKRNQSSALYVVAKDNITLEKTEHFREDYEYNPITNFPSHIWGIKPTLRQQIGGPDGFYFGELRMQLDSEVLFSNSLNFITKFSVGIIDNFDTLKLNSDSVLPHVRTDIVAYLKESQQYNIEKMELNYYMSIGPEVYAKFSAGMFEMMFGGYGGEILYRPFKKNWAIGLDAWDVQQREYNMLFGFRDYRTATGHINFYYKEPRSKVVLTLKGGRFLAKDSGVLIDFARRFDSGLRMGVFFAQTDISKQEFGEGSFDKGFYFQLPIDIFSSKHSKATSGIGLRPLTRDGAAYLNRSHTLFGVTEQGSKINLTRDWDDLYE